MIVIRNMHLRPGNLYKRFVIEKNTASIGRTGRPKTSYEERGNDTLRGVLAEASAQQRFEWQQLQHPITHTIIQTGRPQAKVEDKLVLGNRVYFIQGIDEVGGLGACTIYYVEERNDVK